MCPNHGKKWVERTGLLKKREKRTELTTITTTKLKRTRKRYLNVCDEGE